MENSNIAPFPLPLVIDVNWLVPVVVMESSETSISGAAEVVVDALDVNVIPLSLSMPEVTAINEDPLLI